MNLLEQKNPNDFLFLKLMDEPFNDCIKKSVIQYFKDTTNHSKARLKDVKTVNSNVIIYHQLKLLSPQNVSVSYIVAKIRRICAFISAENDHNLIDIDGNIVLRHYIDARWIFGFLKKKNINPRMVMNNHTLEKLNWAISYLEENKNTKFVNF